MKRIRGIKTLIAVLFFSLFMVMSVNAATKTKVTSKHLLIGKNYTVTATKLKSSKKDIVTLKKLSGGKYRVIARKMGETVITAYNKKGKIIEKVNLLVTKTNPFKYDSKKLTLKVGKSKKVTCKIYKGCTVKYATTNPKIVTVKKDGTIKAINKGKATIKVTVYYKKKVLKSYKKVVVVTGKASSAGNGNNNTGTNNNTGNNNNSKNDGNTKDNNTGSNNSNGNSSNTGNSIGDNGSTEKNDTNNNQKPSAKTIVHAYCEITDDTVGVGEELDKDKIIVTVEYSDGTKERITNFTHTFTPQTEIGTYEVEITIPGYTPKANEYLGFDVNVKRVFSEGTYDPNATLVSISAKCYDGEIRYGHELKKSSFMVIGTFSNGSRRNIDDYTYHVSYVESSNLCNIRFTSGNCKTFLQIPVTQKGDRADLVNSEYKFIPNYVYVGENLSDGQLKAIDTYLDGTLYQKQRDITYITDFTPKTEAGLYKVKVKKDGDFGYREVYLNVLRKDVKPVKYVASYASDYIMFGNKPYEGDLIVKAVYGDGTEQELKCDFDYEEATENGKTGTITVKIPNSNETVLVPVRNYESNARAGLYVEYGTYKSTIKVGEIIRKEDFEVSYKEGAGGSTGEILSPEDFTLSWTSQDKPGVYPLTITAGEFKTTLKITVEE